MKLRRIDIGTIRRDQIIEAAIRVISEKGLQHLSLSKIESKIGMSRGQLTYYFKTKEAILLAVFDRLLDTMSRQHGGAGEDGEKWPVAGTWSEFTERLLRMILQDSPPNPAFACLQYTFLSQISHRQDFRKSLAKLYEEWRQSMTKYLGRDLAQKPAVRPVKLRALATLVQAIFHGLAIQNAADGKAIEREEVIQLCMNMLHSYLWQEKKAKQKRRSVGTNRNGVSHERIHV